LRSSDAAQNRYVCRGLRNIIIIIVISIFGIFEIWHFSMRSNSTDKDHPLISSICGG
jgi:hypothetical protein